jgi:glycosyltransferase involved in cell wall biosynthesis
VEVIHNGIQFVNNGALKDQTLTGKKLVTFLGRVTYQKGPEYFVDAAYQVHQKFPDVHFIMAGAGDLLPAMIEKVASLNMSSHFHFTGFLNPEQVEKVWRLTDVYVMPSVSEPFGITPLEAMQAGIPVIISKQSGVAEVVNQVIKIDFWNTSALAGSIGELLSKPGFANSLIKKSRREVKKISWDSTSKKIIMAYEKILAEK